MFGTISGEVDVNAPASLVWEVYGSLQLAAIVEKGLTDVIEKIEVVEGDGSVGTVLKLLFRPGVVAFPYYKEKFIKIDHEKRVKDVIVVEGGYLDMGFDRYFIRLEIIEKDALQSPPLSMTLRKIMLLMLPWFQLILSWLS